MCVYVCVSRLCENIFLYIGYEYDSNLWNQKTKNSYIDPSIHLSLSLRYALLSMDAYTTHIH